MNTKVLITGADGFIGSHLTSLLLERGHTVKALALYNSFNHWGWLEDIPPHPELTVVTGDIRDPHFVRQLVAGSEIIFHLAALIAIPYSYHAPDSYVDTNVKGTLNICQAARDAGNIRVIHTSTSEVYGTARYVPISEEHPKQPQSPYSASKIGADALALSFYHSFDLPVTIARPFNTYGPRQSARAFIPGVISQIASGKDTIRVGDTSPTRDMNYVGDVCRALADLAETPKSIGKEVNIASNSEISVADTIELIKTLMGSSARVITETERLRPEKSEVYRLFGDNRLIKELTGWEPEVSFKEGLKTTIDWFSDPRNLAKYKTDIFNL
jgi:NAD dependent epimerase/dehydratase